MGLWPLSLDDSSIPHSPIFLIFFLNLLLSARSLLTTFLSAFPLSWRPDLYPDPALDPLTAPFGLTPKSCPYRRPGPLPRAIQIMHQLLSASPCDPLPPELSPGAKAPHYPFISPPSAFLIPSLATPSGPLPWDAPGRAAFFLGPRTASSATPSANPVRPLSSSSSQSAIFNLQSSIPSPSFYQTAAAFTHG